MHLDHDNGYIPFQPDFEHRKNYHCFPVIKGHPLYGIVSDFYQFDWNQKFGKTICVIPDGCVDFVFRYDTKGMDITAEGFHREKIKLTVQQDGCVFGVRFVPGALSYILKTPASELISRQLSLTDLFADQIGLTKMEEAIEFYERVTFMTSYLLSKERINNTTMDIVRYCTKKIVNSHGNAPILELSKDTTYTSRYLRQLFNRYIGVSPKELSEIVQFQYSFQKLYLIQENKEAFRLSDLAIQSGYYDQSHMNKCYIKIAGCHPQKLYEETIPCH